MDRSAFLSCVVLSLVASSYGAITWTQPAGGDGACGSVDENLDPGAFPGDTDIDVTSTANGNPQYSMVTQPTGGQVLAIAGPGKIQLSSGTIDYETAQPPEIVFEFEVEDNEPSTATGTCTVAINDVNDNTPAFAANQVATVTTLTAGTVVSSTFTATDGDGTAPNNQIVSYALDGPANALPLFAVNANTGAITLNGVTGSCDPSYSLVIKAVDGGTPALTGMGTLTVTMTACVTTTQMPTTTAGVSCVSAHTWVTAAMTLAAICLVYFLQ